MSSSGPSKSELETVFNRLRAQTPNKTCFDCNAKNPTWSSVTYGVFICIDCSAVHRNLGVHLTFVRSTNLDTNWTWQQLRQMQLGGNANASQFFRQHNCNTTDAQQKYNSRAAQLYRDKLATAAQNAMRIHGTTLLLDAAHDHGDTGDNKEKGDDFFADCENDISFSNGNEQKLTVTMELNQNLSSLSLQQANKADGVAGAPKVDHIEAKQIVTQNQPVKSTIGNRKILAKKPGLGAKKGGLGATKVTTNFADIEQKAQMADQKKVEIEKIPTAEEREETLASVRLAYQDLSMKQQREEEKLKHLDPAKAKQMERLGMGFNLKSSAGLSHSAISDMQTITQETEPKFSSKSYFTKEQPSSNRDTLDEYSLYMYSSNSFNKERDGDLDLMGFESIDPAEAKVSTMFNPSKPSGSSNNTSSIGSNRNKPANVSHTVNTYDTDVAQKKFGGAKAISSDQYFNEGASDAERSVNMNRFQGSNSISSDDYFGKTTSTRPNKNASFDNFNVPLDDVKESVREGVTRVAQRLGSLANNVMSSIQDKYDLH